MRFLLITITSPVSSYPSLAIGFSQECLSIKATTLKNATSKVRTRLGSPARRLVCVAQGLLKWAWNEKQHKVAMVPRHLNVADVLMV